MESEESVAIIFGLGEVENDADFRVDFRPVPFSDRLLWRRGGDMNMRKGIASIIASLVLVWSAIYDSNSNCGPLYAVNLSMRINSHSVTTPLLLTQ